MLNRDPEESVCSFGWTPFIDTGLCYKYFSDEKYWAEARRFCLSVAPGNGDLASIPDQATNDFLTTLTSEESWIGATDAGSEDDWRWSDGTAWGFTNWSPNNPDNYYGQQHFGAINWLSLGLWDDDDGSHSFICQYKP